MVFATLIASSIAYADAPMRLPPLPISTVLFRIPSNTMEPTIPKGSLVIAESLEREPGKNELVMYLSPSDSSVRLAGRVIGVPEDKIEVNDGTPTINGQVAPSFGTTLPVNQGWFGKIPAWGENYIVPANAYYILVDNRAAGGIDSTSLGAVSRSNIVAKLLPWDEAIAEKGRMAKIFRSAFEPLNKSLPIRAANGVTLEKVEVLDDTYLRTTYRLAPAIYKSLRSVSVESLTEMYQHELCKNRAFSAATGMKVTYHFVGIKSSQPIIIELQQERCGEQSLNSSLNPDPQQRAAASRHRLRVG